jgi:hypothetical protein
MVGYFSRYADIEVFKQLHGVCSKGEKKNTAYFLKMQSIAYFGSSTLL